MAAVQNKKTPAPKTPVKAVVNKTTPKPKTPMAKKGGRMC